MADDDYNLTPILGDPFANVTHPDFGPSVLYREGISPEATLTSYTPTFSERIGAWGQDVMSGLGASRDYARNFGTGLQNVAGLVPGVGQAVAAYDAGRAGAAGNYGGAALAALGALPLAQGGAGKLADLEDLPRKIANFSDISSLFGNGNVYARWSKGPKFDMAPTAKSKDYVSGEFHDGLSAAKLDPNLGYEPLSRILGEYGFVRTSPGNSDAGLHFYRGAETGIDSDGMPTIRPTHYLGSADSEFADSLASGDLQEALKLHSSIEFNHNIIDYYKNNPEQFYINNMTKNPEKYTSMIVTGGKEIAAAREKLKTMPDISHFISSRGGFTLTPVDHDPFAGER